MTVLTTRATVAGERCVKTTVSDDDLAFAQNKLDLNGNKITYASLAQTVHKLKPEVTRHDKFARLVWARVLKGNAEGADEGETLPPNIEGFKGTRKLGPSSSTRSARRWTCRPTPHVSSCSTR